MSQFQNQVLLVTGANRGIGKAIVAGGLQRGAQKVYAAVRRLSTADALVAEFGTRVVPIHLDLQDPSSIVEAAKIAQDVHHVINNAGVANLTRTLSEDAVATLEYEVNVNVSGLIRVAQAFAPILKANGGGTFSQLNSVVSVKTFAEVATSSASKAASYAITQALKEDLAAQGTHVVSVHPGPIKTDMATDAGFAEGAADPSVVADQLFEAIRNQSFHVFPDPVAQQLWQGYQGYAEAVIEARQPLPTH